MGIKTRVRNCLREREHPFDYPDDTIDLLSRLYQNESASVIAQALIDGYEHDRMDASWASSENNAATSNTSNTTDTNTTDTTTTTDSNATTKPETKRKSNEDSMEEDNMEEDNNNDDNMEDDDDEDDAADTATVKNNDTKQRRVTNSPQQPVSNQTNTIPDLHNKLVNLLHVIPSITEVALKDAGGTVGTTKKVTVGDKNIEVSDASKFFNSIKEGVKNNGLVRELAKEDLSGVAKLMIGKDNIINPNPNEKKSTEDGTEGVGTVMSLGAPKVRDLISQSKGKELVLPLQNLSINTSAEQDKVDVVAFIRTVVSQYKKRSKGRSTMLPNTETKDVIRVLDKHIQSVSKNELKGIVLLVSRVFMYETVKMAKESNDFERLDEDYRRLLNVFWNGYPSDASPLYEEGEDNAVDDRRCYKRSDWKDTKKWEEWLEKENKLEEEEKGKWKVCSAKSTNEEEEDDEEEDEEEEEEDDSDDEDSE